MRIFLTGATGFIGTAIIPELVQAGHQVLGLTRSDEGAKTLAAAGVEPYRGTLEDPDSLRAGAAQTDGIIHCAFDHNFANFLANTEKDRHAIAAMGAELLGSDRPFLITSGVGLGLSRPGEPATEDHYDDAHPNPRKASEEAGNALLQQGVNVSIVRLPQVHDPYKQGLITPYLQITREKGSAAYVGEGLNRWAAAHVSDVARLYRLAFEKAERGARYNAVAEEGVPARVIAGIVGRGLKLPVVSLTPEQAQAHFGWMALFIGMDLPASSVITRQKLDWHPTGPTLVQDLETMKFV